MWNGNVSCGCFGASQEEPDPQTSKYFSDISASIAINTKHTKLSAHFSWLLSSSSHLPQDSYAEAHFPLSKISSHGSDMGEVMKVPLMSVKDNQEYYAISPSTEMECGIYPIKVVLYKDQTRQIVLSEHHSKVLSRVNTSECSKDEFMQVVNSFAKK